MGIGDLCGLCGGKGVIAQQWGVLVNCFRCNADKKNTAYRPAIVGYDNVQKMTDDDVGKNVDESTSYVINEGKNENE